VEPDLRQFVMVAGDKFANNGVQLQVMTRKPSIAEHHYTQNSNGDFVTFPAYSK
jgi:hypothetical protein